MKVIGTAGHVDHGKSTLVEALTGTHPDRLKEEREREMTIDLGFAWIMLPDGEEIGVVDVPGHRDFIENMLSGVGGIDAALFVIAADEGVMPQTREHLAILDLLEIQSGVIALTKIDLVDEPDWLDLVEDDVRQVLQGTSLANAEIIRVSARSGQGLEELIQALMACLAERPPRPDLGRPRLPIDRVFSIAGFGTVVTGTLSDGRLRIGDEVQILPQELRGRIRGLQTHKRKEDEAVPGSRTAVNISGVNTEDVVRGSVLVHPADYRPTGRLDARFRHLPDASQPLKHNTEVKMFIGASEVVARVRLLGTDAINPGEEGWLQLEMSERVVVVRGDRYILRRPSPGETIGGGTVVDPRPKGRHKRFSEETLARLAALEKGTPAEVLQQALLILGAAPLQEVIHRSNLDEKAAAEAVQELFDSGLMIDLEGRETPGRDSLVTSQGFWNQAVDRAVNEVSAYHRANPLRRGMAKEELRSRLKLLGKAPLSSRLFNVILRKLVQQGLLEEKGPLVQLPGHSIRFTAEQERKVETLLKQFKASPYTPPSVKESQSVTGEDVYNALLDLGELVALSPEVVFRKEDYEKLVAEVRQLMEKEGTITAAQVRDHFSTSRKYALALLEHLDAVGMTIREGDTRRLRK